MMRQGLIVVGAAGTLGVQLSSPGIPSTEWQKHLFDKDSDVSRNIKSCNLAVCSDIDAAVNSIPFEDCDYWRLLITSGIYDGQSKRAAKWDKINSSLEINLTGVVHWTYGVTEKLRDLRKKGRIVVVSSAASHVGSHDLGYGVAKAGLCGLVRSLSKQHAQHGISTIGVAPSLFLSSMSDHQSDERKQAAINQNHLGRALHLDEVVSCTRFALFEAPDALTGTFINPNGGQVLAL